MYGQRIDSGATVEIGSSAQIRVDSERRLIVTTSGGDSGLVDVNIAEVGGIAVDPNEHAITEEVGTAATDRSGAITLGGTAQDAIALNAERREWTFINSSDTPMMLRFGATASATAGFSLSPGDMAAGKETNALSVYCATTGKAFTAWER